MVSLPKLDLEHICLKPQLHPKFQDSNSCCLRDPEPQFLNIDRDGQSMMKHLNWACTTRGAHKCDNCHFACWASNYPTIPIVRLKFRLKLVLKSK